LNKVRKENKWFVLHLKKAIKRFKGKALHSHSEQEMAALRKKKDSGEVVVTVTETMEGAKAYQEAVAFLER